MRGFDLGADCFTEISAVRMTDYDRFIRDDVPREFWDNDELLSYDPIAPPFFADEEEWLCHMN